MNPVYDLGMATKRGLLNTFGKRARALREDLGLRQEDLIREMERRAGVKVGQTYISELERTEKYPNGDVVAAIARVLGTSADYLLLITDDPEPADGKQKAGISWEAEQVADMIDQLPQWRRRGDRPTRAATETG